MRPPKECQQVPRVSATKQGRQPHVLAVLFLFVILLAVLFLVVLFLGVLGAFTNVYLCGVIGQKLVVLGGGRRWGSSLKRPGRSEIA